MGKWEIWLLVYWFIRLFVILNTHLYVILFLTYPKKLIILDIAFVPIKSTLTLFINLV